MTEKSWLDDPKGCAHCKHCGMDMDMDPYCVHPRVIGDHHPFGLYLRYARKDTTPCGAEGNLFEPDPLRVNGGAAHGQI